MKNLSAFIIVIALLIFGFFVLTSDKLSPNNEASSNNVSMIDGKQIVEIKARGGYTPMRSIAKAGIPTIIRFNTESTFDCSSSVRIPELGISRSLPLSGITDIELQSNQIGLLKGSCGMGMYPFEIEFVTPE